MTLGQIRVHLLVTNAIVVKQDVLRGEFMLQEFLQKNMKHKNTVSDTLRGGGGAGGNKFHQM